MEDALGEFISWLVRQVIVLVLEWLLGYVFSRYPIASATVALIFVALLILSSL
jgi:hypothetical protein